VTKDQGQGVARCPSAPATPGATVIGMAGDDGRIHHFATPLVADEQFIENACADGGPAENRFRFSAPCAEQKCKQWNGSACGLVGEVLAEIAELSLAPRDDTPVCVIRPGCRWFMQESYGACRICSYVVTDDRVS